jgi:Tfp pilus assembly protein PilV
MFAPRTCSKRLRARRGFTLIEAALTTIIIGVGVVSMLQLLAAGTVANVDGAKQTTGINLARNIREMSLQFTFDQVRALNARTLKPPVDSQGNAISELNDWSQSIVVQSVDPKDLTHPISTSTPSAIQVTITVTHNAEKICDMTWHQFHTAP